jgi:WD40 repeat protein
MYKIYLWVLLLGFTCFIGAMEQEDSTLKEQPQLRSMCIQKIAAYLLEDLKAGRKPTWFNKLLPVELTEPIKELILKEYSTEICAHFITSDSTFHHRSSFFYDDRVVSVATSSDNSFIVTRTYDNTIRLWSLKKGNNYKSIYSFEFDSKSCGKVDFVAISSDNRFIIAASDRLIKIWETKTKQLLHTLNATEDIEISSIAISTDNTFLAVAFEQNIVRIFDIETGNCLHRLVHKDVTGTNTQLVAISSDNQFVIIGIDGKIKSWNLNTNECFESAKISFMNSMSLSNDNNFMVTTGYADWHLGELNVFDYRKNSQLSITIPRILKNADTLVSAIAISSDSKFFVTGCRDKTIRIWDLETCKCIYTIVNRRREDNLIPYYDGAVNSVAISSDNKYIIAGFGDGTCKLWSIPFGYDLATIISKIGERKPSSCTIS